MSAARRIGADTHPAGAATRAAAGHRRLVLKAERGSAANATPEASPWH